MADLGLNSVYVAFGGVKALDDVTLSLAERGVHGLIGPNGAGKSTCINVFTGFQRPTTGSVTLDGIRIDGASAEVIRKMGVSRTFQAGRLFPMLTVRENLAAAATGFGSNRKEADREADEILAWTGLMRLENVKAAALPYTDQRRTSIARALVGRPSFLLLDEPAAGMSAAESEDLAALVRRVSEELSVSILIVEHNVSLVLSLCNTITVLDGGAVIAEGPPDAIRHNSAVREAYLGTALDNDLVLELS